MAQKLEGTKTLQNLKDAFARESQANQRLLYFARGTTTEGRPEVGTLLDDISKGDSGHALGHLEYLKAAGDPATGLPIGSAEQALKTLIADKTHESETMYPAMAKEAREAGFDDIATWFERLAKTEKSHVGQLSKALDALDF